MTGKAVQLSGCVSTPQINRAIISGTDKTGIVDKADSINSAIMVGKAFKQPGFVPGLDIPQHGGIIKTTGQGKLTIRTDCYGFDRATMADKVFSAGRGS